MFVLYRIPFALTSHPAICYSEMDTNTSHLHPAPIGQEKGDPMRKTTTKSRFTALLAAVLALVVCVTSFPVDAVAAANKGARLKVSFNGKESVSDEIWDQNTYGLSVPLTKKSKIKKNTTVSYKMLIPKDLLKKDGDALMFCMDLVLCGTYNKKKNLYEKPAGMINKTTWCQLEKEGKKIYLSTYNEKTDKHTKRIASQGSKVKKSGNATVKEQGSYYVITMKDTLPNTCFNFQTQKNVKVDSKKSYYIIPELVVHGDCSKLSGYVYYDEFSVNAATKQTVNFSKKSAYNGLDARHFGGKNWESNCKLVNLPF